MMPPTINSRSIFQYSFIALPISFAGFPLYILAPDFYATHYALSLAFLGTILLVIRLFDAVQDLMIGWVTDKLQGRFQLLVTAAGTILCLSIFGLFNSLFLTPPVWFTVCMFFAVSSYSILTIVLGAQATLWTTDQNDQTRIVGVRESFGLVGLIIAVSMPLGLSYVVNPGHVYFWYAGILFFLMILGVTFFLKSAVNIKGLILKKHDLSLFSSLCALPKESGALFFVYALSMLASSIPAVLVIFYVRDLLGVENLIGPFLLLYFLSGVIAMPFWRKLSIRFGKYKTWGFSNILAVICFIGAFFLNSGDVFPYAVVCLISGLALGADLTLPPSILADHIHARGNSAFSATHYSFLTFIAKLSLALATAIVFPILDVAEFKPQTINSKDALMVLSISYALIPCLLKFMAAIFLYVFFIRHQRGDNNENTQTYNHNRSFDHA